MLHKGATVSSHAPPDAWLSVCQQAGCVHRTAAQDDPEAAEKEWAAASPTYADLKQKYDRSRKTVTRTGARSCTLLHWSGPAFLSTQHPQVFFLVPCEVVE